MNASEFKGIILPMGSKMHRFAYLLLRDASEAEDAVQEVCLKLWRIRDTLNKYKSIEALAMKMTRNWCLDRLKAKKPVYVESYEKGYEKQSDHNNPHKILENNNMIEYVHAIMDQLPEQQKLVIQLRDIEGLEFYEIEQVMEMNANAIRVNLSRARSKIREELIKYESHGYQPNKDSASKIL
jgi:RNA polymerase sigma-70 factor (ECF subfamily)